MRGRTVIARQRALFIEQLAKTANVSASAEAAGFNRRSAYNMRDIDQAFADAWDDALEQSVDMLEGEARRRAYEGVREPLTCRDGLVMHEGEPVYVQKYSDTLMITLLKAHRPKRFAPIPAERAPDVPADLAPDPEPQPDEAAPAKPV